MTDFFETVTATEEPDSQGKGPAALGTPGVEEWAGVPGWPGYEVSTEGRVRRVASGRGAKPGRILKPWISVGYPYVALWRDNRRESVPVHRLVAAAFLPAAAEGQYQVAHRNGDKSGNRQTNLRWATPTENAADRVEHGTDARGAKNPRARLSEPQIIAIRAACAAGRLHREVARQYGITRQTVGDIANRRRWSHVA